MRNLSVIIFIAGSLLSGSFAFCQQVVLRIVQLPAGTAKDSVFAAGNFNGWNASSPVHRFSSDGTLTINAAKGTLLEFKCTLGRWQQVEVASNGSNIDNRSFKVAGDTVVDINIAGWSHLFSTPTKRHTASAQVSVFDTAYPIKSLNRQRTLRVYLPPDYQQSTRRYPVLYLCDGQNVFDEFTSSYGEWKVDETLDSFYSATGKSMIVVAVDHGNKYRLTEYNPYNHERFGKGEGAAYVQFLARQLKPFVDSAFRTLSAPAYNWVAGSSMGGLISQYAGINASDVFGGAGVFSPAFWTAPAIYDAAATFYHRNPHGAVFLYAGALESESMEADTRNMAAKVAQASNMKWQLVIDPAGKHNEATWARWFPVFVSFMFQHMNMANAAANK
jgi:predicted alpha/beta superfamily hydrolase